MRDFGVNFLPPVSPTGSTGSHWETRARAAFRPRAHAYHNTFSSTVPRATLANCRRPAADYVIINRRCFYSITARPGNARPGLLGYRGYVSVARPHTHCVPALNVLNRYRHLVYLLFSRFSVHAGRMPTNLDRPFRGFSFVCAGREINYHDKRSRHDA